MKQLIGNILGISCYFFVMWCPMWALIHYSDKWRAEDIAQYEKLVQEGHRPQYQVMGIPVNWTPYDE